MNTHVHSSIIDSSQKAEATEMSNKGYSSLKSKSVQFRSVTQSCLTLCHPMECSMSGFPVTNSQSLLKLMPIKMVMPFNNLILCRPLLLLPSIFPTISVFSNQSVLCIRWPKYWSFSSSISPSNEYSELISCRNDWLILQSKELSSLLQQRIFSNAKCSSAIPCILANTAHS